MSGAIPHSRESAKVSPLPPAETFSPGDGQAAETVRLSEIALCAAEPADYRGPIVFAGQVESQPPVFHSGSGEGPRVRTQAGEPHECSETVLRPPSVGDANRRRCDGGTWLDATRTITVDSSCAVASASSPSRHTSSIRRPSPLSEPIAAFRRSIGQFFFLSSPRPLPSFSSRLRHGSYQVRSSSYLFSPSRRADTVPFLSQRHSPPGPLLAFSAHDSRSPSALSAADRLRSSKMRSRNLTRSRRRLTACRS